MPYNELRGLLTDIGVEELGHLEMVATIVHQLTRDLSPEQLKEGGYDAYFVDHTTGIYPTAASGTPWSAAMMQSKGDVITDLSEDMQPSKKRVPLTIILSDCPTILTSSTRSGSCANARSSTSNGLAKVCGSHSNALTQRTFTQSTPLSTGKCSERSRHYRERFLSLGFGFLP
jgi:hypothetical protein